MAGNVFAFDPVQSLGAVRPADANPKAMFEAAAARYQIPANLLMALSESEGGDPDKIGAEIAATVQQGIAIPDAVASRANDPVRAGQIMSRAYDIADALYPRPAQAEGRPQEANFLRDAPAQLGASVSRGVGTSLRGLGEFGAAAMDAVTSAVINPAIQGATGNADALGKAPNLVAESGLDRLISEGVAGKFDQFVSQEVKDEMAGLIDTNANLFDPATWKMGQKPTVRGAIFSAIDVFGSMAPVVLATVVTKKPIAGAAVGGSQSAGAAGQNAAQVIDQMAAETLPDGRTRLEAESSVYQGLISAGKSPEAALYETRRRAEQFSAIAASIPGALGGAATGQIVRGATGAIARMGLGGRITATGALSAVEEGAQEVAEGVAGRAAMNAGAGIDTDVTQGTLSEAMLGALGGGAVGGVAGAFAGDRSAAGNAPPAPDAMLALPPPRPQLPGPRLGLPAPPLGLPAPRLALTAPDQPFPGSDGSAAGNTAAPETIAPPQLQGGDGAAGLGAVQPAPAASIPPAGPIARIAALAPDLTPAPTAPPPTQAPIRFPEQKPGNAVRVRAPDGVVYDAVFMGERPDGAVLRINGEEISVSPSAFDAAVNGARAMDSIPKPKTGGLAAKAVASIQPPAPATPLTPDRAATIARNIRDKASRDGWTPGLRARHNGLITQFPEIASDATQSIDTADIPTQLPRSIAPVRGVQAGPTSGNSTGAQPVVESVSAERNREQQNRDGTSLAGGVVAAGGQPQPSNPLTITNIRERAAVLRGLPKGLAPVVPGVSVKWDDMEGGFVFARKQADAVMEAAKQAQMRPTGARSIEERRALILRGAATKEGQNDNIYPDELQTLRDDGLIESRMNSGTFAKTPRWFLTEKGKASVREDVAATNPTTNKTESASEKVGTSGGLSQGADSAMTANGVAKVWDAMPSYEREKLLVEMGVISTAAGKVSAKYRPVIFDKWADIRPENQVAITEKGGPILAKREEAGLTDRAARNEAIKRVGESILNAMQDRHIELMGRDPASADRKQRFTDQLAIGAVLGKYNDLFGLHNKNARQVFEEFSGQKLPKTQSGTREFLRENAPITLTIPAAATSTAAAVTAAAKEADRNPTDAQKEAGNYQKGHIKWNDLDITIETAKGATRSGTGRDGKAWSVKMPAHYGYIKGTTGADGDSVDVYIGPEPDFDRVVVIDQIDADTRAFDEHKVMIGFRNQKEALDTYNAGFSDGRGNDRRGGHKIMTVAEFKAWLVSGKTKKPVSREMQALPQKPTEAEAVQALRNDIAREMFALGGRGKAPPNAQDMTDTKPYRELILALAKAETPEARFKVADDWVLKNSHEKNREYLVVLTKAGVPINVTRGPIALAGNGHTVGVMPSVWLAAKRGLIGHATHNHPSGTALSAGDLAMIAVGFTNVSALSYQGNHSAKVGPNMPRLDAFAGDDMQSMVAYQEAIEVIYQAAVKQVGQPVFDRTEDGNGAHRVAMAAFNLTMARLGHIVYDGDAETFVTQSGMNFDDFYSANISDFVSGLRRRGFDVAQGGDTSGNRPGDSGVTAGKSGRGREAGAADPTAGNVGAGDKSGRVSQDTTVSRAPRVKRPTDLTGFVIAKGGIWKGDDRGDIAALEYRRPGFMRSTKFSRSTFGDNGGGLPIDTMRELAAEAGYLPVESTISDFIDLLGQDIRGDKVYAQADLAQAAQWEDQQNADSQNPSGQIPNPFDVAPETPMQARNGLYISAMAIDLEAVTYESIAREFDDLVQERGYRLLPPERAAILDELSTRGGDADILIEAVMARAMAVTTDQSLTAPGNDADDDAFVPFGGETDEELANAGAVGSQSQASDDDGWPSQTAAGQGTAADRGKSDNIERAGDGADSTARSVAFQTGADGLPQAVIPGTEGTAAQAKQGLTDRQRLEMGARQKQSKIRKTGGNSGDAGPLFDTQGDLLSRATPPAPTATIETPQAPAPDTKAKAKITDIGEKIGGAAKDRWTAFGDKVDAARNENILTAPLSKSWPEPDYQALLDDGIDPWVVAFVRAARDVLPRKPGTPWKAKGWAAKVEILRGMAFDLIDGATDAESVQEKIASTPLLKKEFGTSIQAYMRIGHGVSLKGIKFTRGEYSVYRGQAYNPARVIWTVEKGDGATALSNMPRALVTADTEAEMWEKAEKLFADSKDEPTQRAKRQTQFLIYSRRDAKASDAKVYEINAKIGGKLIKVQDGIADLKEARRIVAEETDQLQAKLDDMRDLPSERREENEARVGADHRMGADVTPEQFAETFAFRGVEFGNYVEQGRRQRDLNESYDALMDLAGVLGLPPQSMSLGGTLGLAFGARGRGGKNPAAAHYEAGKVVINLTKGSGRGSLAHEWFHALDNYFSRKRSKGASGFITDNARLDSPANEGVRPEMVNAFYAVKRAIMATGLPKRSATLDNTRSSPYFGTGIEMHARAFESYVIGKLQDQGASNDYLANTVNGVAWSMMADMKGLGDSYPYLKPEELEQVRPVLDALFAAVEKVPTDRGVGLNEAPNAGFEESKATFEAIKRTLSSGKRPDLTGMKNWRPNKEWLSNALTDSMGGKNGYNLLALVPGRALFKELGAALPSAQLYQTAKEAMDTLRNDWQGRADGVSQEWLAARRKDKAGNEALMDLMHRSTLSGVDPSKPDDWTHALQIPALREMSRLGDKAPDWAKDVVAQIDKHKRAYAVMRQQYEALPQAFKDLYSKVRDEYDAMATDFEAAVAENIETASRMALKRAERDYRKELRRIDDEGLQGAERAEAIDAAKSKIGDVRARAGFGAKARRAMLRQVFESNRLKGPYFPLARFGDYFVTVRDADGKVTSYSRFEKQSQQQAFVREAEAANPGRVQFGVISQSADGMKGQVDPSFVADIENMLAEAGAGAEVMDAVWQRWLETLPDQSVRTSKIHRKGREGFNADAFRAFGKHMFHGAHQLARLKYGLILQDHLEDAKEQARIADDPNRAGFVVNEMEQRHAFMLNPQGGAIPAAMSSLAFIWYLGATPAAALANMSQTTIVGVPIMAARFPKQGVAGSIREISRAFSDMARGNLMTEKSPRLTDDERAALIEGYKRGVIDKTQAHDLASVAESGLEYNAAREKVMRGISWFFHHTERINREVTFLAGYRMAVASGMDQDAAITKAATVTWDTHFDYQNTARPRFMQGDVGKILTLFRNFTVNMLYRLFRDAHQSFNGKSPEVKREARVQLMGMTLSMMAHAGIKGTWGYGLAMSLAALFLPGESDDMEEWLQDALLVEGDGMGPAAWNYMMGAALNGAPGQVTGISLTERIGMPNLWFRGQDRDLEGNDLFNAYVGEVLGPIYGIGSGLFRGAGMVADGEVFRGVETAVPKSIRDLMKAGRYAADGVETRNGDVIFESVNPYQVLVQASGFTPAAIGERYEANTRLKNEEQRIIDSRRSIQQQAGEEALAGQGVSPETAAKIRAFNAEYPEYPITADTIMQSMRSRQRASQRNEFGIQLNPKLNNRLRGELPPMVYN